MKDRLLLALIAAGACTAATAQSSVTLYGVLDTGLQWNKQGENLAASGAPPDWQSESYTGIDGGYQSGNRWGLRGSESLGGGWSALFTLESGFNIDTGTSAQGGRLFGRQAWAGLQGGIGTVALGRIGTPSSTVGAFDMFAAADPFEGAWGINTIGSTFIAANSLREDNSVIYSSPNWGGLRFAAQYSFNVDSNETAPQGSNNRAANVSGSFGTGPFYLVVTYDVINFANAGTADRPGAGNSDEKLFQVAANYDLKFVKIFGGYAHQSNISLSPGSPGYNPAVSGLPVPAGVQSYDNSAYMIGASIPLLGGSLLGSYQYSDAKSLVTAAGQQFEPDYSVWGVGFAYPFSRRTNLYIGYGERSWHGDITQAGGVPVEAKTIVKREQFAFGLRHRF